MGMVMLVASVAFVTLVQRSSADAYRGRVMSLVAAGASATAVLSTAASGVLADTLGVRPLLAIIAAILMAAGFASFFLLTVRWRAAAAT
jgi:hypothetical protein